MISIHSHLAKNPKYNLWLIHGYGESHTCFEQAHKNPLAMEANIFSFDLPGFGDAPLITSGYEVYLHELTQRIEAQNADLPCVILGHSMGGIFATLLAAQLKIPRMILLVSIAPYPAINLRLPTVILETPHPKPSRIIYYLN